MKVTNSTYSSAGKGNKHSYISRQMFISFISKQDEVTSIVRIVLVVNSCKPSCSYATYLISSMCQTNDRLAGV